MAKISRTELKMREIMNKGSEPNFAGLNHNAENFALLYANALNWIHHSVEFDQLTKEVETLLRASNRADRISELAGITAPVLQTMGKIAYCINRGADLSPRSHAYIARALDERVTAPSLSAVVSEEPAFDAAAATPASRINDDYKACYSRLDNLRALFCAGKRDIKQVSEEARKILTAYGTRPGVQRRLVEHYAQSVNEAQADPIIKTWVKPLRAILRVLDKDADTTKPVKTVSVKKEDSKKSNSTSGKTVKKAAAKKTAGTQKKAAKKAAVSKPSKQSKPQGERKSSFASQVREMIVEARKQDKTQADVIEMAISKLHMNRSSARNCVLFNWQRV